MRTLLAFIATSLVLNLVSGNEISKVEDRQMNISETRKCYVYGQCQEYSLDFKVTQDAEGCHKFCGKNQDCNWWSWEPAFELCMLFHNCTEVGIDPPAVEPCPDCISGESECPARECHGAFKCKGVFVDSFAIPTLEECILKCNEVEDCQWFTLEKANDHCILYEECNDQFDCETCATGEKKCANGYKGTTPGVPTGPKYCLNDGINPHGWVCDVDWETSEGYFIGYEDDGDYMYDDPVSIIGHLGCPDGSVDTYGQPPCKPPIFTVESCDLLTGWFTQAKEYCLSAQAEYENYYDWDYYMG